MKSILASIKALESKVKQKEAELALFKVAEEKLTSKVEDFRVAFEQYRSHIRSSLDQIKTPITGEFTKREEYKDQLLENMIYLEEFKLFLPKYLTPQSENILFENLKQFPNNIDKRIYTAFSSDENKIYQGDGIKDLLVINLPDKKIGEAPAMVISNTCDIDLLNVRTFQSDICYCPIFNLDKYKDHLLENQLKDESSIDHHINSIKRQEISQIFFLPKSANLENDSFVFFDRIINCDNKIINRDDLFKIRLFKLSDYGLYLFIFKLSVHFTRINEGIGRKKVEI